MGNSILFSIIELIRRLILPSVDAASTPALTPDSPTHTPTLTNVPRPRIAPSLPSRTFQGTISEDDLPTLAAKYELDPPQVAAVVASMWAKHLDRPLTARKKKRELKPNSRYDQDSIANAEAGERRRRGASRGGGHSYGRGAAHTAETPRRRRRRRLIRREDRHQRRGTGPGDVRGHAGHRGVTRGVQKAARVRVAL